jgi:hypothetical protein
MGLDPERTIDAHGSSARKPATKSSILGLLNHRYKIHLGTNVDLN